MDDALASPFLFLKGAVIHCVAHTGASNRNRVHTELIAICRTLLMKTANGFLSTIPKCPNAQAVSELQIEKSGQNGETGEFSGIDYSL